MYKKIIVIAWALWAQSSLAESASGSFLGKSYVGLGYASQGTVASKTMPALSVLMGFGNTFLQLLFRGEQIDAKRWGWGIAIKPEVLQSELGSIFLGLGVGNDIDQSIPETGRVSATIVQIPIGFKFSCRLLNL
jgi:hypothetical protein